MILNGIRFADVSSAAGARNFFGQGWPHHRLLGPLAPDFSGAGFVAKTTTLHRRPGNMPLGPDLMPRERFPDCIRVNFRRAAVLNAVGLSGPGLVALLTDGRWQVRREPFFLSFMAVADHQEGKISEAVEFARMVSWFLPDGKPDLKKFRAPIGIQVNFSCPNVGLDPDRDAGGPWSVIGAISRELPGVPIVPKFNALFPIPVAARIASHPGCSAVCVSNSIPWGSVPDRIDWPSLFGPVSPLSSLGGGGLSGAPILPLVAEWVNTARLARFPKPIIAGGGVMSPADAGYLRSMGAAAIEVGSAAIVRPWRVRSIIRSCQ